MSFNKHSIIPRAQITITAGTPIPLSASPNEDRVFSLIIQADPGNTGLVYFGDINVAAGQCLVLQAGQTFSAQVDDTSADEDLLYIDLRDHYVDGDTNGDLVNIIIGQLTAVTY